MIDNRCQSLSLRRTMEECQHVWFGNRLAERLRHDHDVSEALLLSNFATILVIRNLVADNIFTVSKDEAEPHGRETRLRHRGFRWSRRKTTQRSGFTTPTARRYACAMLPLGEEVAPGTTPPCRKSIHDSQKRSKRPPIYSVE